LVISFLNGPVLPPERKIEIKYPGVQFPLDIECLDFKRAKEVKHGLVVNEHPGREATGYSK
jgi:hypothetical protein